MFGIFPLIGVLILVLAFIFFGTEIKRKQRLTRKFDFDTTNKPFSLNSIIEKLSLLLKRFPISILCVLGITVLFFVAINDDFDKISYRLWIYFSVAAFISIVATLFTEDFLNKLKTYGIALFAVLLWGIYCFFLPKNMDNIQIAKGIEIIVIGLSVFFAMFFIAFLKKNKDRSFWNFTTQTLFQIALAYCFGAILFGGLSLALVAIDTLFNVSINDKLYANLAVFCFALFASVYFLANVPEKTEKHNDEIFYTKVQKIFALYILTPILTVYAVILYVYLFKIIINWELPNGWVSWLVSALALGGLLLVMLLFPIREQEKNKTVNFISRWLGLFILPLLILMTIGIFRRIGDYGITINRGYILLLNFWFYGIYIYLFFTQSRHIKWIVISPVIIALVTSISVWSVANITKNSLTKEVSIVLNKQVSAEDAQTIFATMTQEERDRMKSTLGYLHENFGKESVQPFFTDTISNSRWNFLSELGLDEDIEITGNLFSYSTKNENTLNIGNYNAFMPIKFIWHTNNINIEYSAEKEEFTVNVSNERVLLIPVREIVIEHLESDEKTKNKKEWTFHSEDYAIWITDFSGYYYQEKDSIDMNRFDCYLFYKK